MTKQGCLYRIKLYRERYDQLNPESKMKLKKNFDKKINFEIETLKERFGHTFTEEDLNGIVVNI